MKVSITVLGSSSTSLGNLSVGIDQRVGAVIEGADIAVAAGVLVRGEQHLFFARFGAVEIAPGDRGAVVRQGPLTVRMRQPVNTAALKTLYSMIELVASLLV